MKICFKCGLQKSIYDFYKHKGMSDGYLGKCKDCTKKDSKLINEKRISTPKGLEKEQARQREKYYRLNYKDKYKPTPENKKKIMDSYKEKYPEKIKCKSRMGKLKPVIKGNHLHHWSYNLEDAKDVIELSIKNHNLVHRFMKYDKETFMYKDLQGNLLDARYKHEKYIICCLRIYKQLLKIL